MENAGNDKAGAPLLPLARVSIFSSGLACFEHSGSLFEPSVINLPFKSDAINDALKSLVLNDPASANPSVSYQSPQTLGETLRSLKVDLSNNQDTVEILAGLRGAELEITAPAPICGRIVCIEQRRISISPRGEQIRESWLCLYTGEGIKMFNLAEINSLRFKDSRLQADMERALDLIAASRNSDIKDLAVNLPGTGSRRVSLSYVIPAPVWKVSYRLDLGRGNNAKPLFQGWAIVDNDSDTDWKDVELSLVAGRPVSFIQNLYPPYYLSRPVLPLAIAGAAAAETHDSAYAAKSSRAERPALEMMKMQAGACYVDEAAAERETADSDADYVADSDAEYEGETLSGGVIETASGAAAGDQFAFTVKNPVNLDRRMSAMLPLAEAGIDARKLLIFPGTIPCSQNRNPRLGAELTNTTGMKLPAGPITVYDGGTYAGDALIEFWNEGEKRLISFGEDLSVTGMVEDYSSRTSEVITVSKGMMIFNLRQHYVKTYSFKNNSSQSKLLLIEHPKTNGAVLESPEAEEQTPGAYRFFVTLPTVEGPTVEGPSVEGPAIGEPAAGEVAGNELKICVRESRLVMEHISLADLSERSLLSYAGSQEIPQEIKTALQKAGKLRAGISAADDEIKKADSRVKNFIKEQERVRKNLEAAGNQTAQGQEYLKKLVSLDKSIDSAMLELEKLNEKREKEQKSFEDFIMTLELQKAVKQ